MATAVIIFMLLGCIIGGQCLVLRHRTPQVVRVREGSTLVLQADVESDEDNLWFYGPGNRQIGEFDHRVDITREEFVIQLYIWRVDRHQSGVYSLKGFDLWSNERLNWSVIVQVVPEYHVSLDTASTCCVTVDYPERSCVTWEYLGCDVVIRDADSKILKEYNQCGKVSALKPKEREGLLLDAAERGDIPNARTLLLLGTRVDFNLNPEGSPLCAASLKGNVEMSLLLLNSGASLSRKNTDRDYFGLFYQAISLYPFFMSPIHCAASSGSIQLVQIFLEMGANISDADPIDRTPFLYGALSGSVPLIKALVAWGADKNIMDLKYRTPIFYAARCGSLALVKYLIDLGEYPLSIDDDANTPLFYAAESGSVELVQFLVSLGSNPLITNAGDESPIAYAARSGSVPMLEAFMKWGANITWKGYSDRSLLHIAAKRGHVSLVRKLIDEGLNVMARDVRGQTPLHHAASEGHLQIVQALINAGASPLSVDDKKRTPLYLAKSKSRKQVVEWLTQLNK
ncbi:ankyrin-1-like [Periplaneta americana]|uniref:ankyrin-1-like n=1 Tax=Periplaneta americana TaxID=6978 RepID=UPI0037E8E072